MSQNPVPEELWAVLRGGKEGPRLGEGRLTPGSKPALAVPGVLSCGRVQGTPSRKERLEASKSWHASQAVDGG